MSLMDYRQQGSHALEKRRLTAVRKKHGFALGHAHRRMSQVDMDHRRALPVTVDGFLTKTDEEGLPLDGQRQSFGNPLAFCQKQILAFLETEQGDHIEIPRLTILHQKERVLTLQGREFDGEYSRDVHLAASTAAMPRQDAQVTVRDIV
jgi:hypothetical protein